MRPRTAAFLAALVALGIRRRRVSRRVFRTVSDTAPTTTQPPATPPVSDTEPGPPPQVSDTAPTESTPPLGSDTEPGPPPQVSDTAPTRPAQPRPLATAAAAPFVAAPTAIGVLPDNLPDGWEAVEVAQSRRVLVLQHIACEPPGVFEDVLRERDIELVRVELDEGETLPATLDGIDAVIAMGGPMSVNDVDEHPWLVDEKRLIREAVEVGIPFWGSCLGVQLLASSLGATVRAGERPEVGVLPVFATAAGETDPVFGGLDWPLPTLQWHGDTFDLPDGATLLATSPAYPHQAFRFGRLAYGVQFHLEVTAELAAEWGRVPAYEAAAREVLGEGGLASLLADFAGSMDGMLADGRRLFTRWLDLWA